MLLHSFSNNLHNLEKKIYVQPSAIIRFEIAVVTRSNELVASKIIVDYLYGFKDFPF